MCGRVCVRCLALVEEKAKVIFWEDLLCACFVINNDANRIPEWHGCVCVCVYVCVCVAVHTREKTMFVDCDMLEAIAYTRAHTSTALAG